MTAGNRAKTLNRDGKEGEFRISAPLTGAAHAAGLDGARYGLGEFEIEPATRRLRRRDGLPVHLANRPFQVLLHLISQRERLVSRRELLDQFWDGRDVYDDSLTRCVSSVRKALGDQGDTVRYIETRWAEGYRYIGPFELALAPLHGAPATADLGASSEKPGSDAVDDRFSVAAHAAAAAAAAAAATPPPMSRETQAGDRPPPRSGAQRPRHRAALAVGALLVLGLSVISVPASRALIPASASTSIAVMPIAAGDGSPASGYFNEGLTDNLISMLSQVPGIVVTSRSSAFALEGQRLAPPQIGRRLNVAYLLEGAVGREGTSTHVSLRLVRTSDGRVTWTGDSRRFEATDPFALQDAIARDAVNALRYRLGKLDGAAPRIFRATHNVHAYRAYLVGRFLWNRRDAASLQQSIDQFERAIALDPRYAAAHAGLADALVLAQCYGLAGFRDAFPRARAAALHALHHDDRLAEAHATLAVVKEQYDFDWAGAERGFQRALELDPNYATAHQWYGELLLYTGRFDEAAAHLRRARDLDPLSPVIATMMGAPLLGKHDFAAARAHYRQVLAQYPAFPLALLMLGHAHQGLGEHDEAIASYRKAWPSLRSNLVYPPLIHAHVLAGQDAEARRLLQEFMAPGNDRITSAYQQGAAYAAIGDRERALRLLERAYAEHDNRLVTLAVDPHLDSLRAEPRFTALSRRIGLPTS